jgi:hypothetical protein
MSLRIISLGMFVVIILVTALVHQCNRAEKLKVENVQLVKFNLDDKKITEWYKNKNGNLTTRVSVLDLSNRNLKSLIESERVSFVKQFKGVKANLKNVEEIDESTLEYDAKYVLPIRDTTVAHKAGPTIVYAPARYFTYSDSLNQVTGVLEQDTARVEVRITAPLQGAIFWQRSKVLGLRIGRKHWSRDITCLNKNVRITQLETIRIGRR